MCLVPCTIAPYSPYSVHTKMPYLFAFCTTIQYQQPGTVYMTNINTFPLRKYLNLIHTSRHQAFEYILDVKKIQFHLQFEHSAFSTLTFAYSKHLQHIHYTLWIIIAIPKLLLFPVFVTYRMLTMNENAWSAFIADFQE